VYILTRDDVAQEGNEYWKPLSKIFDIFPDANLSNTIIVDDRKENFVANNDNGICIPEFDPDFDNFRYDDTSLIDVYQQLEKWRTGNNVDANILHPEIFSRY